MKSERDGNDTRRSGTRSSRDAGPYQEVGKRSLVETIPVVGPPGASTPEAATPTPIPDGGGTSQREVGKQSSIERVFGSPTAAHLPPDDVAAAGQSGTPESPLTETVAAAASGDQATSLDGLEAELGDGEALGAHEAGLARRAGADPASIRVHRGPAAAQTAAQHGARAFAAGNHIVMGSGAPVAGTPEGDELLLHEAAHVAQQQDAARDPVQRKQPIGAEEAAAEVDAGKLATRGGGGGGGAMRTRVQLQRSPDNGEPGVRRDRYYRDFELSIAIDAANHLRTLPFATYDTAVTWTANGAKQFAQAVADQIVAPTTAADLESLVRPEMMGKLIDDARVMNKEPNSGITTETGPGAYFRGVGVAVGNALARRIADSLQREVPRYAQVKFTAGGKEPALGDVPASHPIDPLVVRALAQGNLVTIDGAAFKTQHPELAGPAKPRLQTRHLTIEHVGGGGYWYRLHEPLDATPEEVACALTGSATEAFRLEVAHPLYGLKGDTRGTLETSSDYQNPAGVLIDGGGALADEAALAQAGPITTKGARSGARIHEQMRRNSTLLKTSVREAAQRFGLGRLLDDAARAIDDRAARLSSAGDAEVAKWDAQTQKQGDLIARGARGLEIDAVRLTAYATQFGTTAANDPGGLALPEEHRQVLRADAELWTRAIAVSDLVTSAEHKLLEASQHSMTLEIEILERGLGTPQAAAHGAKDGMDTSADLGGSKLGEREVDLRERLGQMRAQLVADPGNVDQAASERATTDTRNLIFESQVVAQASAIEQAWNALDDADGWMSAVTMDRGDIHKLKREAAGYYARWKAIYADIRKGEQGDKAAMAMARGAFEQLCGERPFLDFLARVNELLKKVQKHHLIASLIAMVVITVASMGAGAALSGFLGGTAIAVEGGELVAGGIGVARNTAAVAGFLAEVASFTYLSNRAFSKDHSIGALTVEFGKNLLMFGAMRGVAAGFKAVGLTKVIETGFKDGATLAQAMKAGGAELAQTIVNGGVGVLMAVIEAKVKEQLGGKPMTEDELDQSIKMTVAQTVIMTIGGRLLQSPIKKLTVKSAFLGKRWQAALDGWTREHDAIGALQATRRPPPEKVVEVAARDRAQIEKEIAALEELREAAEHNPKALDDSGTSSKQLDAQLATLHQHADNALGIELAMSMKELAPNHYEAPRAQISDILATHGRLESGIALEATDPKTGARTWKITPKGDGVPPFHVTEAMPDWALTPTGKRVIEAARKAGMDDAAVFKLPAVERVKLLAADEQLAKSGLDPATLHKVEEALVAAGRSPHAVEAVAKATPAQLQQIARMAEVSAHATGKLLNAVGLDAVHHHLEPGSNGQVRINGELEIHPSRLDEIADAHLRTILEATSKSPVDTVALGEFAKSGSYRLRFRFQLQQNETWLTEVLDRIGRRSDPAAKRILDSLDDAGRARLQESRGGSVPRGVGPELQNRAAGYALDQNPTSAREFVDRFEMFTSEYSRVRDEYSDLIETKAKELIGKGSHEHVAERQAAKEVLGTEVQGFGTHFNKVVLELVSNERVSQRASDLRKQLAGRVGPRAIPSALDPATVVADVRKLPPLRFGSESSGSYHPNKHGLPKVHNEPGYAPNEVSRYLKSANETIQNGLSNLEHAQDGGCSLTFTHSYGNKRMTAIVKVSIGGDAVIATYGDAR